MLQIKNAEVRRSRRPRFVNLELPAFGNASSTVGKEEWTEAVLRECFRSQKTLLLISNSTSQKISDTGDMHSRFSGR